MNIPRPQATTKMSSSSTNEHRPSDNTGTTKHRPKKQPLLLQDFVKASTRPPTRADRRSHWFYRMVFPQTPRGGGKSPTKQRGFFFSPRDKNNHNKSGAPGKKSKNQSSSNNRKSATASRSRPNVVSRTDTSSETISSDSVPTEILIRRIAMDDMDDDISHLGILHPADRFVVGTTATASPPHAIATRVVVPTTTRPTTTTSLQQQHPTSGAVLVEVVLLADRQPLHQPQQPPPATTTTNIYGQLDTFTHKMRPAFADSLYAKVIGTDYSPAELGDDAAFWDMQVDG
jgi:hypothetical protein